jgi:O-antigen ligase
MIQASKIINAMRLGQLLRFSAIAAAAFLLGRLMPLAAQNDLPILRERSLVFVFMLVPIALMVVLLLARAEVGFGLIVIASTLAISKTGFQMDIGPVRTSALEALIVISAPVLILRSKLFSTSPRWPSLPLDRALALFVVLTLPALAVAYFRQVSWANVFWEYKGYFLYPLLVYVMVAWIRDDRRWYAVAAIGLIGAIGVALTGLASFRPENIQAAAGSIQAASEARTGGIFGVINQYGYYLASMTFIGLGVISAMRHRLGSGLSFLVVCLLVIAMALAGSRSAWLGLAAGGIVFMILGRPGWKASVFFLVLVGAIFLWQFQFYGGRLLTLEDSSAEARAAFADVGWLMFQRFPIFGAGWGSSFVLDPANNLVPSGGIPWLHNDYLNLLTQTGVVGLAPFLLLWVVLIWRTLVSLFRQKGPRLRGPIAGALAGIVVILVGATAEQIFARPDIAGQAWWLVGMLISGIAIRRQRATVA